MFPRVKLKRLLWSCCNRTRQVIIGKFKAETYLLNAKRWGYSGRTEGLTLTITLTLAILCDVNFASGNAFQSCNTL